MTFTKLNPLGIAHYLIPVAVFVLVGVGGGAFLLRSHATTCSQGTFGPGSNTATRGSTGCVGDIQLLVNGEGYQPALIVDGGFGAKTKAGVEWVQKTSSTSPRLSVDGVVGPKTWQWICYAHRGGVGQTGPILASPQSAAQNAGC